MGIQSYRDLRVWQAGMDLVENVYRMTKAFPRQELYGLTSPMQRASVSIPSNIAEGHTREHTGEYLQHLSIAQSSLAELETQLEIAIRLGYVGSDEMQATTKQASALGRQLYALRNSLTRSRPPTPGPRPPTPGNGA
jgi:four helix bundle protein